MSVRKMPAGVAARVYCFVKNIKHCLYLARIKPKLILTNILSRMSYLSYLLSGNVQKWLFLICFIIPIFFTSTAKAQGSYDSKYGISIGTDYDVPVGNFSYTFKPTMNYNLSFLMTSGSLTGSVNFGYHNYKAKQDTFYYQVIYTEDGRDHLDYGSVHYENFPVYSIYLGLVYNLELSEQLKIYAGANLGAYYTHFVFQAKDVQGGSNTDLHERDLYIAPRLGLTYSLANNIGIGMEGKYNFFAPTGDSRYSDRVGTLYNSYSVGVRLIYNF